MRATIICAAPEQNPDYIAEYVREADIVYCADGGLEYANTCSIVPDIVIGDMDSYSGEIPVSAQFIKLDSHKDDTDTLFCIKKAIAAGCEEITLVCALGGRIDHTLANVIQLDYMQKRGVRGRIVSANETVILLTEGKHMFYGKNGITFSVFAFNCDYCYLSYKNTEYPLDGSLTSDSTLGISNVFTSDEAEITVKSGQALLIMNGVR